MTEAPRAARVAPNRGMALDSVTVVAHPSRSTAPARSTSR
jgi:hypothetical protein